MFTPHKVCNDHILSYCRRTLSLAGADTGISVISMLHAILILRLYALFGSKKLAYGLSLLLFATIIAEVYIVIKYAPSFGEASLGQGLGNTCVVPPYSHGLTLIW